MADILDYREDIDKIDGEIVELLISRFKLVKTIGEEKAKRKLPIFDERREKEILKKVGNSCSGDKFILNMYTEILAESRRRQENK